MNIKKFFEHCDNDKMVLPDFQRDFVWKTDKIKRLLSSFMLKLPIGSFLVLEGSRTDFKSRKICFPTRDIVPKEECLYLLDGQQRLSTLKAVFSDLYECKDDWKTQLKDTYSQLRNRWFIRVIPRENEEDVFGWKYLCFPDWSSLEPPQILELLESRAIYRTTNLDKWYHPSYNPKKDGRPVSAGSLELEIARNAYNDGGLLPLYTFSNSGGKPLHERVLEQIAQSRIDELQAFYENDREGACAILERVEPDIKILLNNKEDQKIQIAWLKLSTQWATDVQKYMESLLEQEQHVINLEAREIGRAISIFENINQGGTPLDVYDLIVAKAAHDGSLPSLTQRILDFISQEIDLPDSITHKLIGGDHPVKWDPLNFKCVDDNKPERILKYQFLNLLSILAYCADNPEKLKTEHIKKGKILDLKHEQINSNAQEATDALARAFAFLQLRCGVVYLQDTPYELMILPIAYYLRREEIWASKKAIDRLEYWYWTSIFGGAYRQAQNDRTINDFKHLGVWMDRGEDFLSSVFPSVLNYQGYSEKSVLMMEDPDNGVPESLYKAILQYILSRQPNDFLPGVDLKLNPWDIAIKREITFGEKQYELSLQDHHIIPLFSATTMGKSADEIRRDKNNILNSVLNRTFISKKANSLISSREPHSYMSYMNDLSLLGHCIPVPFEAHFSKGVDEEVANYHERVLESRYNEIFNKLGEELNGLR